MNRVLIVGGANGIGLSIAHELAKCDNTDIIYIVDKVSLEAQYNHPKINNYIFDLKSTDYSFFDRFYDIDSLVITAGFGRVALFKDLPEQHIIDSFNVNTIPVLRLIKRFYYKLESKEDFYCGVMDSISGWMSSPLVSVYGATKAALKIFIESVNVELAKSGSTNRILNVSPGAIKGSSFYGKPNDLDELHDLSCNIIEHLKAKDDLFIPKYEEVFKEVLQRYHDDFRKEGAHSYDYKINSDRYSK